MQYLIWLFREVGLIPPRSVQEIFNVVLEQINGSDFYMCAQLKLAQHKKLISSKECAKALKEIDAYLMEQGYYTLEVALYYSNLPCGREDRVAIYSDWDNRPALYSRVS